jgi:hypothetical protein
MSNAMDEQFDVDCGMALAQLPNDETGQSYNDNHQHAAKEGRLEPLEIVALIEDDVHATEDHGNKNEPDVVKAGEPMIKPPAVNQRSGEKWRR